MNLTHQLLTLDISRDEMRKHAHTCLREMLAESLRLPASHVQFERQKNGRLHCPRAAKAGVTFSLSYAPPHALVVVANSLMLGCDIERVIDHEPSLLLLEQVFSEDEMSSFLKLSSRRQAFTQSWVLKEAVLKARGVGLASSPHDVPVQFSESSVVTLSTQAGCWQTRQLDVGPDHNAVIVWHNGTAPLETRGQNA